MLLNKLNVGDKGFVAILDSQGKGKVLQELQDHYFSSKINSKLLDISSATLIIKCPIFVQLNLYQCGFNIINTPIQEVEAYVPDISEIKANDLEDRKEIHNYIKITTEALLLNQKGLAMDGADLITSQLLTPISTYNELIVTGTLRQWIDYLNQKDLPLLMNSFQKQVKNALETEWRNISSLMKIG